MGYLRAHTTPEKLVGLLAYLAGLIPRPTALRPSDLVPEFSWSKVGQQTGSWTMDLGAL